MDFIRTSIDLTGKVMVSVEKLKFAE